MKNLTEIAEAILKTDFISGQELKTKCNNFVLKAVKKRIVEELTNWFKLRNKDFDLKVFDNEVIWVIGEKVVHANFDKTTVTFDVNGKQIDQAEIYGTVYNNESGQATNICVDLITTKQELLLAGI